MCPAAKYGEVCLFSAQAVQDCLPLPVASEVIRTIERFNEGDNLASLNEKAGCEED